MNTFGSFKESLKVSLKLNETTFSTEWCKQLKFSISFQCIESQSDIFKQLDNNYRISWYYYENMKNIYFTKAYYNTLILLIEISNDSMSYMSIVHSFISHFVYLLRDLVIAISINRFHVPSYLIRIITFTLVSQRAFPFFNFSSCTSYLFFVFST